MYELEQEIDKAILYFERAAELFEIGGGATSANQCNLKVAQFSAQMQQYVASYSYFSYWKDKKCHAYIFLYHQISESYSDIRRGSSAVAQEQLA